MCWIGFNQHTAPPITKEVGRTERELQLWSHGEEEREELHGSFQLCFRPLSIVILPWRHRNPTQRNSSWVAPKNGPSGLLPGIRLSPPTPPPSSGCLGKLLVTYQNPTQLSSLPETLPCPTSERANHTLHSSTSQPSTKTVQAQNTQLLIVYQEPSTDQKVLEIPQWTRWARSLLATNV